ncbi:hypothetical protein K4K60_001274 [Colletotrichum sp. SAR11_57]|nr:hypothetical protein K4K60_001274 [Colletotrichum sp. SAR11_57]
MAVRRSANKRSMRARRVGSERPGRRPVQQPRTREIDRVDLSTPKNLRRVTGRLMTTKASMMMPESNSVGVWYSRRNVRGSEISTEVASAVSADHAEHQFLAVLPRRAYYEKLEKIYLRDVHRIFPVLNLDILKKPVSTTSQILCKQAICLAAGSSPSAKPFLSLGEDSTIILTYPEFAQRLSSAIRKAIGLGLEGASDQQGPEPGNNAIVSTFPEQQGDLISTFDPSFYEGAAGLDVFEYFDPSFDLNAIDAILGGDAPPEFGNMAPMP